MISRIYRVLSILAFLVGFVVTPFTATGQKITGKDTAGEELFMARVKQFGEFAARFNNSSDFRGNPPDSAFRRLMPREKMLSILFDLNDPRVIHQNKSYSAEFVKTRDDFIKEVSINDIMLDKHSPGIIAEARSRIVYNGEPKTVSIYLNQEIENKGIKWVILSVRGVFDDLFKTDTSVIRFIQPASNETDFINLKRALDDKTFLQYYAYGQFKPDNLSMFFYCINTGVIKYEYAEEVIYHVISIPGWYFRVKDFNRNELNSGWLISDLTKGNFKPEDFR